VVRWYPNPEGGPDPPRVSQAASSASAETPTAAGGSRGSPRGLRISRRRPSRTSRSERERADLLAPQAPVGSPAHDLGAEATLRCSAGVLHLTAANLATN
jgi:hypothetical protein